MQNSKLIQLFQILSETELKRFYQFLKSPFYNNNAHLVKFYLLLRGHHPAFNSSKLAYEKVFKKLFPKRDYEHQKMLNLMSDLTGLLKKYLQVLQLEKQEPLQQRLLLDAYAQHPDWYTTLFKEINKAEQALEESACHDAAYHRERFRLSQLYFNHPATDKFQLSKAQYEASIQHLDRWYIMEKLLLSCQTKAREKPLAETYEIWLLPEIRERVRRDAREDPLPQAYLAMLELMEQEDGEAYRQLKSFLTNSFDQFEPKLQRDILQSLINFAIARGNRGDRAFLQENLELYQFGLEKGLFLTDGLLDDMTYISIVNVALRMGQPDWCREFIAAYEPHVDMRARKDAHSLALALWLYAARQADAALDLLQEVDFLNLYYQIQARVLMIKIYFEAFQRDDAYLDLVAAQSDAFERYLRRNKKVGREQRMALLNFAASVKRLAKLQSDVNFSEAAKEKFRAEMQELRPLYNRSWILQQLA